MRHHLILVGLATVCTTLAASTIDPHSASGSASRAVVAKRRTLAHAHNDYAHARPLLDALDAGIRSVEADIYYADGTLAVSHDNRDSKGTLESLYLAPLQDQIVSHGGSVYGDGRPFRLVIDLKDVRDELPAAIDAVFARYPMLSRFADGTYLRGPVEVVFTGDEAMKRLMVSRTPWGTRDINVLSANEPVADPRWTDFALRWSDYINWNGEGVMPDDERRALAELVGDAHAMRREIRMYGAPDRPSVWAAEIAAGVDFISTDDLTGLSRFLRSR